ncbi:MAG: CvpA family protein [Chlorobi bacterium]|nr:CvpA family protein [Chlorobiota bacterium]
MNVIDLIIVIPLAWSAYKGFSKGLIVSIASLLALLLGVYGAIKFSDITSGYLIQNFDFSSQYLPIISFAITFILIVVAVHLLARVLDKIVKAVALGFINRISGALFGIIKTAFILSVILTLINKFDEKTGVISPELKESSLLYIPLTGFAPLVFPYLDFEKINGYVPESVHV